MKVFVKKEALKANCNQQCRILVIEQSDKIYVEMCGTHERHVIAPQDIIGVTLEGAWTNRDGRIDVELEFGSVRVRCGGDSHMFPPRPKPSEEVKEVGGRLGYD